MQGGVAGGKHLGRNQGQEGHHQATDRGAGPMVWVVDPPTGRLEPRPVSIRALQQDTTLVTGLRDGERVVALGVQKLDPAARVRIADTRPSGT